MDRKEKIMKRMQEHYDYIKDKYEVVALFLQGSQNYGLDVYNDEYQSDIDTKAIILPTFNDFILGKEPISATLVLENEEHIDVKDIRVMFTMFRKANISYIELLFSDFYIVNPKYQHLVDQLWEIRDDIIDYPRLFKAIYGMVLEKRKALCHPYPTIEWKINKWGYDGKQLSHLIRLYLVLQKIDEYGYLNKSIYLVNGKDKQDLINIKENKLDFPIETIIAIADKYCEEAKRLVDIMIEDEWREPSIDKLNNILIKALRQYFREDILNNEGDE